MHIKASKEDIGMSPILTFLKYCENSKLEKEILDCGAGGERPPLHLFYLHGFKTHGIDISEEQVAKANAFCKEKGIDLDIRKGDMRSLPFEDNVVSFVYSYDTIFHMRKKDVALAMEEMKRVLKKKGLIFVNFVSTEHSTFGKDERVGPGEFMQSGHHGKVLISYYEDDEPDPYFGGLEILCKQKRIMGFTRSGARALGFNVNHKRHVYASLDYFARKK